MQLKKVEAFAEEEPALIKGMGIIKITLLLLFHPSTEYRLNRNQH